MHATATQTASGCNPCASSTRIASRTRKARFRALCSEHTEQVARTRRVFAHVCADPSGGREELLPKELFTLLDLCVSSLRRGNANLLCVVQILTDVPRRESVLVEWRRCEQESGVEPKACGNGAPSCTAALAECGRHAPSERTRPPATASKQTQCTQTLRPAHARTRHPWAEPK